MYSELGFNELGYQRTLGNNEQKWLVQGLLVITEYDCTSLFGESNSQVLLTNSDLIITIDSDGMVLQMTGQGLFLVKKWVVGSSRRLKMFVKA